MRTHSLMYKTTIGSICATLALVALSPVAYADIRVRLPQVRSLTVPHVGSNTGGGGGGNNGGATTGNGGNGGNGSDGGSVQSGDTSSSAGSVNSINRTVIDIRIGR